MKPTYRKTWARNLLMCSHLALDLAFKVKLGQPNLKVLTARFLLILEVCNVKQACRISWAGNLVMWLDLTFGLSFKLKRLFTRFGELSFR